MMFFAKFHRSLFSKKVAEPNGCRFSLTFESRLCRRGVRRAQWLHVFPQNWKSTETLLESVPGRFCPATSHLERPDATNRDAISLITFEANPALVLPFSMLEFGSVSCYGCSFVWIFCIRLNIWSFFCWSCVRSWRQNLAKKKSWIFWPNLIELWCCRMSPNQTAAGFP